MASNTIFTNSSSVRSVELNRNILTVCWQNSGKIYRYKVDDYALESVKTLLKSSEDLSIGRMINFITRHPAVKLISKRDLCQSDVTVISILEPSYVSDSHSNDYDDTSWA